MGKATRQGLPTSGKGIKTVKLVSAACSQIPGYSHSTHTVTLNKVEQRTVNVTVSYLDGTIISEMNVPRIFILEED